MSQHYSDPTRESEDHALPDVEVFYIDKAEAKHQQIVNAAFEEAESTLTEPGWYYWFCFPGCLSDSEPIGPFETRQAAVLDAQEGNE